MQELIYKTGTGETKIFVGKAWKEVDGLIDAGKTVIITDTNVDSNYSMDFPLCNVLVIEAGEQSKSLITVEKLVKDLLRLEVDRGWFLLGIGGGVVCDICGFVASVYMRGINFGFVSTSLLSQIDASTGGKNGVNSHGYKNVIGCFSQPEFVICDPAQLKSLPEDEFISGLGELAKHAIIRDKELFNILEDNVGAIKAENYDLMEDLIARSLKIKISIVEEDEQETSVRRLLNFGHTIGHAIEAVSSKKHGFAIAEGMFFSSLYAFENNILDSKAYQKIISLLKKLSLLKDIPVMSKKYIDPLLRDKKRESNIIYFVVPHRPGEASVIPVEIEELINWMKKQL